jgi:streptomycin 6-kinase
VKHNEIKELADLLSQLLDIPSENRERIAAHLLIVFNDSKSSMRNTLRWLLAYKRNEWEPPD